jgi:hypothetical protein
MNPRSTWNWIIVAVALFAFIFLFERHQRKPTTAPQPVLPQIKSSSVTSVLARPAGQLEVRADRTNDTWTLTRPVTYPAQSVAVNALLDAFQGLTPMAYISTSELRQKAKFDEEYGFDEPQYSVTLLQGEDKAQILFGALTAPGDQVYVQVVGAEGVYVVSSDLLKLIPRSPDQWRDKNFAQLDSLAFDRISVSGAGKNVPIALFLDPTNKLWRISEPLPARADGKRILELLEKLKSVRVEQFVADDAQADMETYGLKPADIQLTFASGSNTVALVQFGKATTNDPPLVFARRAELGAIVTIPAESVTPWRASVHEFRDHFLLSPNLHITRVDVRGENSFTLQYGNGNWTVMGETFPVDKESVGLFLSLLGSIQIAQFMDGPTAKDLADYGLDAPSREILLWPAGVSQEDTNSIIRVSFGKTNENQIFVRRSDEQSAYAVKMENVMPVAAWELRDRGIWNFSENDVSKLTVTQDTNKTELIRHGTNLWSFGQGSQGEMQSVAVETVAQFYGTLSATVWRARGDEHRERYGFDTNTVMLAFELKNGDTKTVEIGRFPYAAIKFDNQTWIFELPSVLRQLVDTYLSFPTKQ